MSHLGLREYQAEEVAVADFEITNFQEDTSGAYGAAPLTYTVSNASPKELYLEMILQLTDVGEEYEYYVDLSEFTPPEPACPDLVSYCQANDPSAASPFLPALNDSLPEGMTCSYFDDETVLRGEVAAVRDPAGCRSEVKPADAAKPLIVKFECGEK